MSHWSENGKCWIGGPCGRFILSFFFSLPRNPWSAGHTCGEQIQQASTVRTRHEQECSSVGRLRFFQVILRAEDICGTTTMYFTPRDIISDRGGPPGICVPEVRSFPGGGNAPSHYQFVVVVLCISGIMSCRQIGFPGPLAQSCLAFCEDHSHLSDMLSMYRPFSCHFFFFSSFHNRCRLSIRPVRKAGRVSQQVQPACPSINLPHLSALVSSDSDTFPGFLV